MSEDIDSSNIIRNREIPGKAMQSRADYAKRSNLTRENTGGSFGAKEQLGQGFIRTHPKGHVGNNLPRGTEYAAERNVDKQNARAPLADEMRKMFQRNSKTYSALKGAELSDETIYEMMKDMRD